MSVDPKIKGVEGASGKDRKALSATETITGITVMLRAAVDMLTTLVGMLTNAALTPRGHCELKSQLSLTLSVMPSLIEIGFKEQDLYFRVLRAEALPKNPFRKENDPAIMLMINQGVRLFDGSRISITTVCHGNPCNPRDYSIESTIVEPDGTVLEPFQMEHTEEGTARVITDVFSRYLKRMLQ